MITYKTYQECKIANPECDVAVVTGCDEFTPPPGEFIAVLRSDGFFDGYAFADKSKPGSPNISDGYYKICNPSDHCMAVKEFLDAGYRFEVGDYFINNHGEVVEIGKKYDGGIVIMPSEANLRIPGTDEHCYILRAAALEEKSRTKVEYVKVNGNYDGGAFWECAKDYSEGVIFTTMGSSEQLVVDSIDDLLDRYKCSNLYRRIETTMTEREAFIEEACEIMSKAVPDYVALALACNLYNSGKFKLVN